MGTFSECTPLALKRATTIGRRRIWQQQVCFPTTFISLVCIHSSPLIALEINRTDCWATHAKAHVLEMEGRTREGIQFLEGTVADWQGGGGLACHNYWHLALYYIDAGNHEAAMDLFDREINIR